MKVAVIGSRELQVANLGEYLPENTTEIISGGARGVDTSAREYAQHHGLKLTEYLPEYRKYGKASLMVGAGFSKNAKSKGSKNIQPPDWKELADKMYCELYPEIPNIDDRQKKEWENQRIIKTSGKNVSSCLKMCELLYIFYNPNWEYMK